MNPNAKGYVIGVLVLVLTCCGLASGNENALIWSTFLGGGGWDRGCGIARDNNGDVYVTGFAQNGFPTTIGAYKVMMMFSRPPHQITAAATVHVHFTDESKFSEYVECAVDGNQSDSTALLQHLLVYGSRLKVFMAIGNGINNCKALWGKFVAMLFQCRCYFFPREFHCSIFNV